jgi:hypothetical protein
LPPKPGRERDVPPANGCVATKGLLVEPELIVAKNVSAMLSGSAVMFSGITPPLRLRRLPAFGHWHGIGGEPRNRKLWIKRGAAAPSCGTRGGDALVSSLCGRPPGQERGKRMGSPPRCLCCRSSFAEPTHFGHVGGSRCALGRAGRHRRRTIVSDIETAHLISCHRNVGCMTGCRRVSRSLF